MKMKSTIIVLRVTNDKKSSIIKLTHSEEKQVETFMKIFSRLLANTPEEEEKVQEEISQGIP